MNLHPQNEMAPFNTFSPVCSGMQGSSIRGKEVHRTRSDYVGNVGANSMEKI
jgi:hypothetical protein